MDVTLSELTGGFAARQLPTARPAAEFRADEDADDGPQRSGAGGGDSITLSAAAEAALGGDATGDRDSEPDTDAPKDETGSDDPGAARGVDGEPLTDDEVRAVERLQQRDREVRAHEQAHQAAGGAHAGTPSYDYDTGPDGKQYATSGEVPIDTAVVPDDPQATIAKMEQVKRAALAAAEPSGADRAIAAKADQARIKAQQELRERQGDGAEPTGALPGNAPPEAGQPSAETGAIRGIVEPGRNPSGAAAAEEQPPAATYAGRGSLLSLST